ncbi:MAG: hypothetical protein GWN67_02725 [Phycisphaerae bacterium]|nr:hypothetical protein [Phycisphaerae bacterium]NIW91804.1 hypothetical protein [Phycisphaerae bacterium]
MPIYLKEVDVVAEVAKFQSALIVLCRFCPAASLAVRNDKPYLEFFRRLLKTEPYEALVDNMQSRLKKEGLKTAVFKGNLLNYLICLWTSGWRKKLIKRASQFEAVVVMGCESAYESVKEILKSTDCQVFQGMESEGVLNAIPKVHLPLNISFEKFRVTPMIYQGKQSGQETGS